MIRSDFFKDPFFLGLAQPVPTLALPLIFFPPPGLRIALASGLSIFLIAFLPAPIRAITLTAKAVLADRKLRLAVAARLFESIHSYLVPRSVP